MAPSSGYAPSAGSTAGLPAEQRVSLAKLNADQARLLRNRYDVEIQKKFSLAAACIIFVLIGAPIALRFPRGGVGLTIAVSLGVFALYYVCLIAGEELANRGYVAPFWAMWAANVLFTVIGLVLLARMGREGATARGGDFGEAVEQLKLWAARQVRRVGIRAERRAPVT
jgi:lipopolysaccharide export system permease protein